ncbi:MAG: hypothetical protein COW42_09605 [Deltaproteobacteria bacterium CG17_big_fil_post_rev_8_21_14_2_50_63_7]|nr:MAG: hypothetical protein COW42_09605 [Deltaproteobacteria bacterium CG17_big_fil_post_rev_8_21_14_2_50_63_7]
MAMVRATLRSTHLEVNMRLERLFLMLIAFAVVGLFSACDDEGKKTTADTSADTVSTDTSTDATVDATLDATVDATVDGTVDATIADTIDDTTTDTADAGCTSNGDCTAGVCNTATGMCVDCMANGNCAAPTPTCDMATHTCVADCASNTDCTDSALPACDVTGGVCVECIDNSTCADPTPTCDTLSNTCKANCASNTDCVNAGAPVCDTNAGVCVECLGNGDCTPPDTCDLTTATCVTPVTGPNASASAQIATAWTQTATLIDGAAVTYIKGTFGSDPAGFFLQAEQTGPAIFVRLDASTTSPALHVGDIVTLHAETFERLQGRVEILTISGLTVGASGYDVDLLAQDVNAATDLVTNLDGYKSELVTANVTLTAGFSSSGTGFVDATVSTAGLPADPDLQFRLPVQLASDLGFVNGCSFMFGPTPLWSYESTGGTTINAQPSIWVAGDVTAINCPAPIVLGAFAPTPTSLEIAFNRDIDAATVVSASTQFVFDNGLTASAAVVSGSTITLTTSTQSPGITYTVTVSVAIADTYGKTLDPTKNTASFQAPSLLITEVLYNPAGTDTDLEWVKLYNGTGAAIDLSTYSLGYGGANYASGKYALSGTVPAGECWLVGGPTSNATNGDPIYDLAQTFSPGMQNSGADADGVALFNVVATAILATTVPIDAVIYGPTNTSNLIDETNTVNAPHVLDAGSGNSIRLSGGAWMINTTLTPNECP